VTINPTPPTTKTLMHPP